MNDRLSMLEIPKYPRAFYTVDVAIEDLEWYLDKKQSQGLNLDPDYQRGHVWTEAQQIAYIEYLLRGGEAGRNIIINSPRWTTGDYTNSSLLDGKQRVNAILKFMAGNLPVFGGYTIDRIEGVERETRTTTMKIQVVALSRKQCLEYYINLNAGGTPHSEEEIERVKGLLQAEQKK